MIVVTLDMLEISVCSLEMYINTYVIELEVNRLKNVNTSLFLHGDANNGIGRYLVINKKPLPATRLAIEAIPVIN